MIAQAIGAVVRALLQVYGGSLVTQGYLDNDSLNLLIGSLISVATVVWSIIQKKRSRTVPGGKFNPRAAVKKAQPVSPQSVSKAVAMKGGFFK